MSTLNGRIGESLTPSDQSRINSELGSDERLLWAGTANSSHVLVGMGLLILLVFLALGALILAWGVIRIVDYLDAPKGFARPWWTPFLACVLLGIGGILTVGSVGAVWNSIRYWRTRLYALTDRRAIVWAPLWSSLGPIMAQSYYPDQLAGTYRMDGWSGSGNLIFADRPVSGVPKRLVGFLRIKQVREVERLLREHLLEKVGRVVAPDSNTPAGRIQVTSGSTIMHRGTASGVDGTPHG